MNDTEILAAVQPSISRGGDMTILSTPRGRANRFWDVWDDPSAGYSKHRISWQECPDVNYKDMIKLMRRTMLDLDFRQEYCCDPSISDMAFFTRELLAAIINHEAYYLEHLETKNRVVMGVDFGKRVSSTAITIAELCEDRVRIRLQEELRNMPYDFEVGEKCSQLQRISAVNDAFNVDEINIDATGVGVRLEEDMRRRFGAKVEPVIFTLKTKEILITNLRILCEKRGIELVNDEEFIAQLLALEKDVTPSGNIRYKHVKGKKDDRVWSAALAVKDMLSADIEGGAVLGSDAAHVAVNRHLDSREPYRGESALRHAILIG
jgi:phage FluMu gp28-like protein